MKKFFSFLLISIGNRLPISNKKYIGIFGKKFRCFCAKRIGKSIGIGVNVEKGAILAHDTVIGDRSAVGINCIVSQNVVIGKDVMMGPECLFYSFNHKFEKNKLKYAGYTNAKTITIEDNVWLGARCIILPGVTIGEGSTVGAGSVVTKDIPPYSVVAGNPAIVKKSLLD